ncbi:hypothetical protein M9H77_02285 [Catharanthus roseus]|uniref:Uncharacterized protein n=1 Tax=Catharanthus roseus TaxID=4058 RepID=A0ACC0C8G3_CATRO|nr:hypothetical protein M9H77_02285 [Catharanthus roseus]
MVTLFTFLLMLPLLESLIPILGLVCFLLWMRLRLILAFVSTLAVPPFSRRIRFMRGNFRPCSRPDAFSSPPEKALKSNIEEFEGQNKPSKLLKMYLTIKDQSREQLGVKIGAALGGWQRTTHGRSYPNIVDLMSKILMIAIRAKDIELEIVIMIYLVKLFKRNKVRNGRNYVYMDDRFHKRKGDYEGYYESYNYGGYNCRKTSQTLGTTSRPLSNNKLKLPLLCGTLCPYDYEVWEKNVESLFYSYCVREEESSNW